jgi:Mg/Co/Ni transporter MgtE
MAKNSKPMIRIHDLSTDEVIDREMSDEEYAAFLEEQAIQAQAEAERLAKEQAKAEALAALGLTEEQLQALLG